MGAFLNTAARYTAVYLIGGIIARVADDTRKIRLKSVCERQLFRTVLGSYNNALSVCIRISPRPAVFNGDRVATEGQTVEIDFENWVVKVDGVALDEPYVRKETNDLMNYSQYYSGPFKVGKGKVFVMGDNRNGSNDSRNPQIGQIDVRRALGKVLIRFAPFDRFGVVD
jgi:hypothetical protein